MMPVCVGLLAGRYTSIMGISVAAVPVAIGVFSAQRGKVAFGTAAFALPPSTTPNIHSPVHNDLLKRTIIFPAKLIPPLCTDADDKVSLSCQGLSNGNYDPSWR